MSNQQTPMSDAERDAISRRCDEASPGPWKSFVEGRDHTSGSSFIMTGCGKNRGNDIELSGATAADQDFIAQARQDIPRLLDEIARLRNFAVSAQHERERLDAERKRILDELRELGRKLREIDREFSAIDAYEAARTGDPATDKSMLGRAPQRGSSKRERLENEKQREHRTAEPHIWTGHHAPGGKSR